MDTSFLKKEVPFQWKFRHSVYVLLGIFFLYIFGLASDAPAPTSQTQQPTAQAVTSTTLHIGDNGYIKFPSPKAILANTKEDFSELTTTYIANDTMGIGQFLLDGRGTAVSNGTKVLVIDSAVGSRKVRVIEGDQIGASGWIAKEFVSATK